MRKIVKVASLLGVAFVAPIVTAGAQQVAPAAVVRRTLVDVRAHQAPTDSIRPLSFHMKRGAAYGGVTGVVLSSLVILAIAQDKPRCCEAPTTSLTPGLALGVLALGAGSGLAAGAFLGFTYHFQLVEQRQRATAHR